MRRFLPHHVVVDNAGGTRLVAATLAAREIEARAALIRLRDCSRKIEEASGVVAVRPRRADRDRVRHLLRVLTTEAARLRMELRSWDVASSDWIDRVNGRLEQLTQKIEAMQPASGSLGADPPTATSAAG